MKQLNRCFLISSSKAKNIIFKEELSCTLRYVSRAGKFIFIVDSHPRDTVGFVKCSSYANVIKSWRNSKPAVFPREALSEDICAECPPLSGLVCCNFVLRKDHIQIPTLPLANKEGSICLGWTFQEFVGYRNRPQKNKQSRRSVGSWRMHRALPGLASLLSWIRLQIWGEKISYCAPAAVSGKPPWLLTGADGHPSEQAAFLLHLRYHYVILVGTGVQDTPLFVWKAMASRG